MISLFISDLHLSSEMPELTQAFYALLAENKARIQALYILGDWFETWVGDDDDEAWLHELVEKLTQYTQAGIRIYVQHGNRDFLLGEHFVSRFGGVLLPAEYTLHVPTQPYPLTLHIEHGDRLCTDDLKYQTFRQMSRNPDWQQHMLNQPLTARKAFSTMARAQSKMNASNTPNNIMDVNDTEVKNTLSHCHVLVHGHTHRPHVHTYTLENTTKQRMVLGDWRVIHTATTQGVEAVIVYADDSQTAHTAVTWTTFWYDLYTKTLSCLPM